ncbi:ATP-binding cassette domain-containing protein [Actinospica sp. MGRD01-02]|uniref:ATP-binding cassette domain-containing protein n=1 Tax=Actinospica acidithermotolerans TaxID=2828514 RepID=A0A941IJR0_9ACTN|nr:ATP-binding cassette domain-containing protein [Actinospica acidithermotolerans]MBR7827353.1 ATP-binding cassette domain-containing protein [Actinospica acidithermotolerans]
MNTRNPSEEIAIQVEGLVKRFGEQTAVDHVDLAVPAGSVFGLLGPNGAGKTTIVRMLSTLLRPDGGTARVAGLDVVGHAQAVRRVIGLTGQFAAVDEALSGYENVYMIGRLLDMPRKEARQRAEELLAVFGLEQDARKIAKQYSGGMRRRLDLAASLVGRPRVLFLDEPTTGLDPARRNDLWDIVRDLADGGTTVLLTTQYMEEAEALAQDIAVMDHGHFIARGTADELKVRIAGRSIRLRPVVAAELSALREVLMDVLGAADEVAPGTVGGPVSEDAQVARLLQSIAAQGIAIADISTVTASLDEVFLTLTEKKGGVSEKTSVPEPTHDDDSSALEAAR